MLTLLSCGQYFTVRKLMKLISLYYTYRNFTQYCEIYREYFCCWLNIVDLPTLSFICINDVVRSTTSSPAIKALSVLQHIWNRWFPSKNLNYDTDILYKYILHAGQSCRHASFETYSRVLILELETFSAAEGTR